MSLSTWMRARIISESSGCGPAVGRLLWEQEVAGSIPATPTIYELGLLFQHAFRVTT